MNEFNHHSALDRSNWQHYSAVMTGVEHAARTWWDNCILSAKDQQQATSYEEQLRVRARSRHLSSRCSFEVIADDDPLRLGIGSGGSTLNIFRTLISRQRLDGAQRARRVLVIHSGGLSKRLPQFSAAGKLFAPVSRGPDTTGCSAFLDEVLATFSRLPTHVPEGVLVCCADVILMFGPEKLAGLNRGITVLSAPVEVSLGSRHGTIKADPETGRVLLYAHKPSPHFLREYGFQDEHSKCVQVDTGAVWFSWEAVEELVRMFEELTARFHDCPRMNLYNDVLSPFALHADPQSYYEDRSEGDVTQHALELRSIWWSIVKASKLDWFAVRLNDASFIHVGTMREYFNFLWTNSPLEKREAAKQECNHARVSRNTTKSPSLLSIASHIRYPPITTGRCCIVGSTLNSHVHIGANAMIINVTAHEELIRVPDDAVLDQVRVVLDGAKYFVSRVLGLDDDPKNCGVFGSDFAR